MIVVSISFSVIIETTKRGDVTLVAIQYIEGACVEQIYLKDFDLANIDIGDSTTTVTIFKSDGEARFFVGLTSDWNK